MDTKNMYDMIIIGGGPAGLSSAIYMARAKYKTLVIEKEKFGGQITITSEIVNYPGVYNTSGTELTKQMQKQGEKFGAEFVKAEVVDMELEQDIKTVKTSVGTFTALSVVLAVGASPRKVGFEGEQEFMGRGVAYCATCDGEFFTNKHIYVVGGGFAAVEEAIFLTKYAKSISLLVREGDYNCAKTVSDHLKDYDIITTHFNTEVVGIYGDNTPTSIKIKNNKTNQITTEEHSDGFGTFVFAGYVPNTKWLLDKIQTESGYIKTDNFQATNIGGVYAAGDVCIKQLRQVVTAVSDGATAATSAEKYVEGLHKKLNIPAFDVKSVVNDNTDNQPKVQVSQDAFLSAEMIEQLLPVFDRFQNQVCINAVVDDSQLGLEMSGLMQEMSGLHKNLVCKTTQSSNGSYLQILDANNNPTGIEFYAMPGGHEFNSFILALYNVAGPGQATSEQDLQAIQNITEQKDITVVISLTCTMCPETVVSACKLSAKSDLVNVKICDIVHFADLKEKHNIMSVPCTIINGDKVHFGKKDLTGILELVK